MRTPTSAEGGGVAGTAARSSRRLRLSSVSDMRVNDSNVICDGVHTANATVYLIDSVLMPPAR